MSSTPVDPRPTTITEEATGRDHLVSAAEFALGRTTTVFRYRAVCGRRIRPAPLTCPPSGRCRDCMAWAARHLSGHPPRPRGARRLRQVLLGRRRP